MPGANTRQRRLVPPEYQEPELLDQDNPTQNEWYTIGAVMLDARIYQIAINIEDTNETLQCQILIDGEVIAGNNIGATFNTAYYILVLPDPVTWTDETVSKTAATYPFPVFVCEGRSVEVQARKTTNAGVGALTGIVTWGHYEPADV